MSAAHQIMPNAMVGLGLRREMLDEFCLLTPKAIEFFEVAPENWMTLGGKYARQFKQLTERHPFFCHGLSLSIGSPAPLDTEFVKNIKTFLDSHKIEIYSEHLSYCSGAGHMYDLMPIPFTEEAVIHTAKRIKQVEDILERPFIVENVSFYAAPGAQMTELAFVNAVLTEADCKLLLDVNNIYVNSVNHQYDANAFLAAMPTERIAYLHIAGHYQEDIDLMVDTHGADIIDPVWALLQECYRIHGVKPTLLERDFNIPPTEILLQEINQIHAFQQQATAALTVRKA
ncbi:HvfB family MNIO-type RiPP peptide maturase [Shewanella sp. HL-SH5]|uniref:HvfB family MNIO-type RiPP peptide maturase n=1 Tax=Shewanella sp. HL-SH5 TaxID=3436241 RepID=UPI003EB9971D